MAFGQPLADQPVVTLPRERVVVAAWREMRRLCFLYKTCPKCAKKYGKNYVVLLAQV